MEVMRRWIWNLACLLSALLFVAHVIDRTTLPCMEALYVVLDSLLNDTTCDADSTALKRIFFSLSLVAATIELIGYWLVTSPDPGKSNQEKPINIRTVVRYGFAAAILIGMFANGLILVDLNRVAFFVRGHLIDMYIRIIATVAMLWDGGNEIWNNDGSNININYTDV